MHQQPKTHSDSSKQKLKTNQHALSINNAQHRPIQQHNPTTSNVLFKNSVLQKINDQINIRCVFHFEYPNQKSLYITSLSSSSHAMHSVLGQQPTNNSVDEPSSDSVMTTTGYLLSLVRPFLAAEQNKCSGYYLQQSYSKPNSTRTVATDINMS